MEFQFHYGTIKTLVGEELMIYLIMFQFHYGTIKTLEEYNTGRKGIQFQFHYGTIKTPSRILKRLGMLNVSIPLWYD